MPCATTVPCSARKPGPDPRGALPGAWPGLRAGGCDPSCCSGSRLGLGVQTRPFPARPGAQGIAPARRSWLVPGLAVGITRLGWVESPEPPVWGCPTVPGPSRVPAPGSSFLAALLSPPRAQLLLHEAGSGPGCGEASPGDRAGAQDICNSIPASPVGSSRGRCCCWVAMATRRSLSPELPAGKILV